MNAATNDTPWLARPDWASGRIKSSQGWGLVIPWSLALGSTGITSVHLYWSGLFTRSAHALNPDLLTFVPFVLISAGLMIYALRRTWLAVRSGASTLQLASTPGSVGAVLAGVIHGGPRIGEGQGLRLILRCIRSSWIYSYERETRTLYSSCVWENDQELAAAQVTMGIPVRFDIPADVPPTVEREDTEDGWRSVSWILEALGEPGAFWRGEYEVPVFRTGRSVRVAAVSSLEEKIATVGSEALSGKVFSEQARDRIARPPSTRIKLSWTGHGLEIVYPYRNRFLMATLWFIITLPLYIAPLLRETWSPQLSLPFISGFVRALMAGLLLNGLPTYLLVVNEPRRVVVGAREIVVTCGWPILGGTRHFNLDEYDGIEVEPQLFSVLALRKDASVFKRRFFIANNLRSHAEARWVASEVERAARRTRKNHRSA